MRENRSQTAARKTCRVFHYRLDREARREGGEEKDTPKLQNKTGKPTMSYTII